MEAVDEVRDDGRLPARDGRLPHRYRLFHVLQRSRLPLNGHQELPVLE